MAALATMHRRAPLAGHPASLVDLSARIAPSIIRNPLRRSVNQLRKYAQPCGKPAATARRSICTITDPDIADIVRFASRHHQPRGGPPGSDAR
ncbi:hypothetical protein [Nocardia sp. CA-119907]|uniref:hypothetical protein n=1 Tax=Nocardia sp. CA-119907 TaxID=3239973 RepID=UPI003D99A248